jgi:hypothetical protein
MILVFYMSKDGPPCACRYIGPPAASADIVKQAIAEALEQSVQSLLCMGAAAVFRDGATPLEIADATPIGKDAEGKPVYQRRAIRHFLPGRQRPICPN